MHRCHRALRWIRGTRSLDTRGRTPVRGLNPRRVRSAARNTLSAARRVELAVAAAGAVNPCLPDSEAASGRCYHIAASATEHAVACYFRRPGTVSRLVLQRSGPGLQCGELLARPITALLSLQISSRTPGRRRSFSLRSRCAMEPVGRLHASSGGIGGGDRGSCVIVRRSLTLSGGGLVLRGCKEERVGEEKQAIAAVSSEPRVLRPASPARDSIKDQRRSGAMYGVQTTSLDRTICIDRLMKALMMFWCLAMGAAHPAARRPLAAQASRVSGRVASTSSASDLS